MLIALLLMREGGVLHGRHFVDALLAGRRTCGTNPGDPLRITRALQDSVRVRIAELEARGIPLNVLRPFEQGVIDGFTDQWNGWRDIFDECGVPPPAA